MERRRKFEEKKRSLLIVLVFIRLSESFIEISEKFHRKFLLGKISKKKKRKVLESFVLQRLGKRKF